MKQRAIFTWGGGALILILLLAFSLKTIATNSKDQNAHNFVRPGIDQEVDVSITIDKSTTSSDLEDIMTMLEENGIDVEFTSVVRNDLGEITGISINLSTADGQSTNTTIDSNQPINDLEFGRKGGQLYISPKGMGMGSFSFSQSSGTPAFKFGNDSLIQRHFKPFGGLPGFDPFANGNWSSFGSGRDFNVDQIFQQMQDMLSQSSLNPQMYQFYDDPNMDKYIVIDGEAGTLEQLQKLAESGQIEALDRLKPETAVSIYGDVAKDGAIIVTTKE